MARHTKAGCSAQLIDFAKCIYIGQILNSFYISFARANRLTLDGYTIRLFVTICIKLCSI